MELTQLDFSAIISEFEDDWDILVDSIEVFSRVAPEAIQDIIWALEGGDTNAISELAHSLRGSASSLYANPLMELLRNIEDPETIATTDLNQIKRQLTGIADDLASELDTLKAYAEERLQRAM